MVLAGRKSHFRTGFRPDSKSENHKIGRRDDVEAFPTRMRPGRSISGPEALLRNINRRSQTDLDTFPHTLCYAMVFEGRKSGFRAAFRPDSNQANVKIGRRADFEAFPIRTRPGSPIPGPETLLPNLNHKLHCSSMFGCSQREFDTQ